MAVSEYSLGEEVMRKGERWLVVRVVERDSALIVNEQNEECISIETYVMLKSAKGEIDFEVLINAILPYTSTVERTIPSLPNLRRRNDPKNP